MMTRCADHVGEYAGWENLRDLSGPFNANTAPSGYGRLLYGRLVGLAGLSKPATFVPQTDAYQGCAIARHEDVFIPVKTGRDKGGIVANRTGSLDFCFFSYTRSTSAAWNHAIRQAVKQMRAYPEPIYCGTIAAHQRRRQHRGFRRNASLQQRGQVDHARLWAGSRVLLGPPSFSKDGCGAIIQYSALGGSGRWGSRLAVFIFDCAACLRCSRRFVQECCRWRHGVQRSSDGARNLAGLRRALLQRGWVGFLLRGGWLSLSTGRSRRWGVTFRRRWLWHRKWVCCGSDRLKLCARDFRRSTTHFMGCSHFVHRCHCRWCRLPW